MSIRILIVDAYEAHRKVVVGFINHIRPGTDVHQFDPSIAGRPHADFDWAGYALVVMDSKLGKENGLQWLEDYSSAVEDFPPVMFLSSQNDVDTAVRAMKLGARDYIVKKGVNQNRLRQAILDIVPIPPMVDIMPDMKPLPEHSNTMDYTGADTQVLPEAARDKVAANLDQVDEVIDDSEAYWAEQTQILHEPPV